METLELQSSQRRVTEKKMLTATELVAQIKAKKISPKEYLLSCLQRYNECEPLINSFTELNKDLVSGKIDKVLEQVKANEALSYVPFGVKDIFNVDGSTTTHGSPIYKNYRPGNDARPVFSMKFHGGIYFGKNVTAEFAVHEEPKTRNPWDLSKTSGTSSNGSVAAVASGVIPISLTSQTAGSTIRPASYCGIYGFKPTFGTIPRTAVLKTTDTLDTIGLVARSSQDILLAFDCIRMHGWNYPIIHKFWADDGVSEINTKININKKVKIGIPVNLREKYRTEHVRSAFSKVQKRLSDNKFEVVEFNMNEYAPVFEEHEEIYCKSLWYYFKYEREKFPGMFSDVFQKMVDRGAQINVERYYELLNLQNQRIDKFNRAMSDHGVDFLIEPSASDVAPDHGDISPALDNNLLWTYLHVPVCTVPRLSVREGLPVGLSVISRKFSDYDLLNFSSVIPNYL